MSKILFVLGFCLSLYVCQSQNNNQEKIKLQPLQNAESYTPYTSRKVQ